MFVQPTIGDTAHLTHGRQQSMIGRSSPGGANVDIWGAILVLARRFYITVPLAAASLIGAYTMSSSVQPEYSATASVVLIGPTAPPADKNAPPAPVNPYV